MAETEERAALMEKQEAYERKEFLNIISKIILRYSECMENDATEKGGK